MDKLIIDENYEGLRKKGYYHVYDGDIIYSGSIIVNVNLYVKGAIKAGESIEAGKWIEAGESIEAGKWIEAGKSIEAGKWIKAGESRAVVGALADRLRAAIEEVLPEAAWGLSTDKCIEVIRTNKIGWSYKEVEDVLRSLDRARFAPAVPTDVALLIDQVDDLIVQLNDLADEELE